MTQFLDIGSGLPTMDNVHQVARGVHPDAAVVYVDNDATALTHANALLATSDGVVAMYGDVREPAKILADVQEQGLLDLTRPVVVLLAAIFHFITDDEDPIGIVRTFAEAMPSGSYLILTTAHHDSKPEESARATRMYRRASSPMVTRSKRDIAAFFEGFEWPSQGWPARANGGRPSRRSTTTRPTSTVASAASRKPNRKPDHVSSSRHPQAAGGQCRLSAD